MSDGVNANDDKRLVAGKLDKRNRLQQRFWLDMTRADDESLAWYIEDEKDNRRWQKTVTNALRLYWSLSHGRLDWLLTLFPNVVTLLYDHLQEEHQRRNDKL